MSELILHHYDASPFAEKARLMLGFKQLSWRSVEIPRIMPKPDLTALTGGYRKTPVLQVGADIYCDTALIARRLEAEKATPSLFPEGQEFVAASFAQWADAVVFQHAVTLVFQPESIAVRMGKLPPAAQQAFVADRAALFAGGSASRLPAAQAKLQWPVLMARLQQQLAREEGDFLCGEPSIADFAMAHPLWFLKGTHVTAPLVDDYPEVATWLGRVLGFGHGAHSPLSSEEAIAIARAATPAALPEEDCSAALGFQVGQQVSVAATDYGVDPVQGELLCVSDESIILRRQDERAGTVHVHFPRLGFSLTAL
jgi:glutathione S-transferase